MTDLSSFGGQIADQIDPSKSSKTEIEAVRRYFKNKIKDIQSTLLSLRRSEQSIGAEIREYDLLLKAMKAGLNELDRPEPKDYMHEDLPDYAKSLPSRTKKSRASS